jgi:hypothetical protein
MNENLRHIRHDQVEQSDIMLHERLAQLTEIDKPWQHSYERLFQIRAEMSFIAFEQMQRYAERHQGNKEKDNERVSS